MPSTLRNVNLLSGGGARREDVDDDFDIEDNEVMGDEIDEEEASAGIKAIAKDEGTLLSSSVKQLPG